MQYAHSTSCALRNGPRPEGTEAAHECGHPPCISGAHLNWKTPKGNAADRAKHGTLKDVRRSQPGERNKAHKLTEAEALELRAGSESSELVGPLYGVSGSTVRRIRRGESWKHL